MLRARVWAEHRPRWDFTDDPPGGSLFRVAAASNSLLAHHVSTGFGRQLKLAGGKPMLVDKQLAFGFSHKFLD